jgi:hypothetical protein
MDCRIPKRKDVKGWVKLKRMVLEDGIFFGLRPDQTERGRHYEYFAPGRYEPWNQEHCTTRPRIKDDDQSEDDPSGDEN